MPNKLLPYSTEPLPVGSPVADIEVDKLLLDAQNPRMDISDDSSQDSILRQLYQDHRLEELMSSLLANGYFHEEPLVAIPTEGRPGHFVVVEGNRRLAALKLLLDPKRAAKLRATTVPDASEAQLERLRQVPVKVYDQRAQVLPYLGFRHITGVKEWDSASKARYVYQLKQTTSYSLDDIANMIGDTYNMTERLYLGWSLLRQATDELGLTQGEFVKFPFSYMYDAVRMPEVRLFLGVKPAAYKVPAAHKDELRELLFWLFGSKVHHRQPIVERKEQLKKLAAVVSDKRGLSAIRTGATLDEAFQETIGEENMLIEWLTKASRELDRAKGVIHRHRKATDVRELVTRCYDTATRLDREIRL